MKLSIITICYNSKNLKYTLDSIKKQTWQDFEWIVIDGKSRKKFIKIFEKYKDRIDVFISEKDNGIYDAMNKGIKKANGKYILFMNAGDGIYSINTLENIFKNKNYNEDILYGNVNIINSKGKNHIEINPPTIDLNFLIYAGINHQSVFIKKELFDKFGYYNTNYKIASDYDKFLLFKKNKCSFKYLNTIIANYYNTGISSNKKKTNKERKYILTKHFTKNEIKQLSNKNKTKIKICGVSIFQIINKYPKIYIKILDCFPLLKIKQKKVYLFGINFLPIFKIERND